MDRHGNVRALTAFSVHAARLLDLFEKWLTYSTYPQIVSTLAISSLLLIISASSTAAVSDAIPRLAATSSAIIPLGPKSLEMIMSGPSLVALSKPLSGVSLTEYANAKWDPAGTPNFWMVSRRNARQPHIHAGVENTCS